MKTLVILFSLLLLTTSAGHAQKIPPDAKITLKRSAEAKFPNYTVTIHKDGRVDYAPGTNAKKLKITKKISLKDLGNLLKRFDEADFPTLAAGVKAYKKCCSVPKANSPQELLNFCTPNTVAGAPVTEITVTQRGRTSVATHDAICYGEKIFKPLDKLAKEIDKAVGL